jgi:hypothetical protein
MTAIQTHVKLLGDAQNAFVIEIYRNLSAGWERMLKAWRGSSWGSLVKDKVCQHESDSSVCLISPAPQHQDCHLSFDATEHRRMFLPMDDDEKPQLKRLSLMLLAAGIVAGIAALAAPATCGVIGGFIMALCIGNAIAMHFIKPDEKHYEHDSGQCDRLMLDAAGQHPAVSQHLAQAQGKQWTTSVVASSKASRSR